MTRRKDWKIFLYGLLLAAAMLFFTTRSSPAWPINDWCDANIYLTVGKGMTQGQVVYRDLYDHKGPLLYALHAICALISFDSFLGVYLMEVLLAACFLFFGYKAMRVYASKESALLLLPVLAWSVYAAWSFCEGDSAEEMCMPLVAASLWHVMAFFKSGKSRMNAKGLITEGALAGCVLWIKFTGLGMQAGLLFAMLLRHLVRREWKDGLRMIGWLMVGFLLSTLPWIVYFGLNGAIGDWLGVYFYDNLFRYGGASMTLLQRAKAMVLNGFGWLWKNAPYTVAILGGLLWFILRRTVWEWIALVLAAAFGAALVFFSGVEYPYYGQALAPLAIAGFAALASIIRRPVKKRWMAAVCAMCIALCPLTCYNWNVDFGCAFLQPKEETMQYQLARVINETPNATLLNYGFMDAGFFTAAGIAPSVKFFHSSNVDMEEKREEQLRYIREGLVDYVVVHKQGPKELEENYELVATVQSPNFWYENVFLYRILGTEKPEISD